MIFTATRPDLMEVMMEVHGVALWITDGVYLAPHMAL